MAKGKSTSGKLKPFVQTINSLISDTGMVGYIKVGEVSDGYHTFDELYNHRIVLYIALCRIISENDHAKRTLPYRVWKSKKHSDGSCFEGWFVLGIDLEEGEQITYHLPMVYWDKITFAKQLKKAPTFDGHNSTDVLKRISKLAIP